MWVRFLILKLSPDSRGISSKQYKIFYKVPAQTEQNDRYPCDGTQSDAGVLDIKRKEF